MLVDLTIRNFAVLRDTRIGFSGGFNAVTGETGAGKSIVIDALGAVLGARTSSDFVRSGESAAYVEAVFDISGLPTRQAIETTLDAVGIDLSDNEPLILSRDIAASGRSTARINGRALTASVLTDVGELLVDIHGQSDHLSLLRSSAQLDLLDRFAGVTTLREQVSTLHSRWNDARRRLLRFDDEQRERARRLDTLRFQSDEIFAAELSSGEEETLRAERSRLVNTEKLAQLAAAAFLALEGDEVDLTAERGGLDSLRATLQALDEIALLDPEITSVAVKMREALFAIEETASEIRSYADDLQSDPMRLAEIDDRLELIRSMKRKYGADIETILGLGETIQSEIEQLEQDDRDVDSLSADEARLKQELAHLASSLSGNRKNAATELASRVEQVIKELNMGNTGFEVRIHHQPDPDGIVIDGNPVAIDSTGVDRVAFFLAANQGEELRPLARVASGGETARIMLALKSILSDADDTPTLVFDEIDVGVGGRSGQVVGEKLWGLTGRHQVIVISHLPQIAAFADRHITMVKGETGGRTETVAVTVTGETRTDELAMMFDGLPVSAESRANARALLARVNEWKAATVSR
jgi:DNA repair protein RecN (Recombination protein N)